MTQQRIPVLLCFLLPAALVGCGGGSGTPSDAVDPDAPPVVSDKQPPPAPNQNPVNPASVPPVANQNPASTPSTPGPSDPDPPGGGGGCRQICEGLADRGCMTPEEGCDEACRPDPEESCSRDLLDLRVCAAKTICPSDLEAQLQQVMATCPNEYGAFTTCVLNSGSDL